MQYDAAGNRSWMLADERGSVIALANDSAAMTAIDTYDEYGMPSATNQGTFQYAGMMWLARPGVYAPTFRAYAQHLGRFNQTDPIGFEGDGPNLYAYVLDDPVNFLDRTGQYLVCVQVSIGPEIPVWQLACYENYLEFKARPGGALIGVDRSGGERGERGNNRANRDTSEKNNTTRPCTQFQKTAENVADFFGNAASDATNLSIASLMGAGGAAAIGFEPGAAFLGGASAHFGRQAAVYGAIAGVASFASGNSAKAISDQLTSFALKKVAPFLPREIQDKIADQMSTTGSRCQ